MYVMAKKNIPEAVTACAINAGYDSAIFVVANWRSFTVFSGSSAQNKDGIPRIGLPFFILYKNGKATPATDSECHAILRDLPDE